MKKPDELAKSAGEDNNKRKNMDDTTGDANGEKNGNKFQKTGKKERKRGQNKVSRRNCYFFLNSI